MASQRWLAQPPPPLSPAPEPEIETGQQEIELALNHTHLPRLADAGLVNYDAQSETVTLHEQAPLRRLLDLVTELER